MKKTRLLLLIPALFSITACGLGSEIKAEKAEEIAENMAEMDPPENIEMKFSGSETNDNEKIKFEYVYKQNADNEIYAKINVTGSDSDDNVKGECYLVNNDEYGKVAYAKMYDYSAKKDVVEVITYKNNASVFDSEIAPILDMVTEVPQSYYIDADELKLAIASYEAQAKTDDLLTVKYYSKGDNNLTIKATYKGSKTSTTPMNGTITITFDKGYLTSYSASIKYYLTDKTYSTDFKGTVTYPKSLKISLPSDWENYL